MKIKADDPAYWDHEILTDQETRALAVRARDGDKAAREELILKNQKLVVRVASYYRSSRHAMYELVSAGNRGLITAIDKYDPTREARLTTYAWPRISREIQHHLRSCGFTVRIAESTLELVEQHRKLGKKLRRSERREVDFDEICAALKLRPRQKSCLQQALRVIGLDFAELADVDSEHFARTPRSIEDRDDTEVVDYLLSKVPEMHAQTLCKVYGVGGSSDMTFVEIGKDEGRSWQAVQQTHHRAIATIRELAASEIQRLAEF